MNAWSSEGWDQKICICKIRPISELASSLLLSPECQEVLPYGVVPNTSEFLPCSWKFLLQAAKMEPNAFWRDSLPRKLLQLGWLEPDAGGIP
jgi:hypothetical protein